MDPVFSLSLCYAPEHHCLQEGSLCTHLVPHFLWLPHRGCLLIAWLWEPGELMFLSHGSIIIDVTQKGASTPVCCPDFCDCFQGTILYCQALACSGAYIHGFHRIVFLDTYYIQAQQEVTGSGTWFLRRPIS